VAARPDGGARRRRRDSCKSEPPSAPSPNAIRWPQRSRRSAVELGRELAELIPTSTYVEVPIRGHIPALADMETFLDPIESFFRDTWESDVTSEPHRVLATVLFTDIVESTAKMSELGDAGWRDLLERHHAIVRTQLARARGREVDTAGNGFFASFDGPARAVRCAKAIVDGVHELGSTSVPGCTQANASSSTPR
jgi:class 3 adenylate cyclase